MRPKRLDRRLGATLRASDLGLINGDFSPLVLLDFFGLVLYLAGIVQSLNKPASFLV